MHSCLHSCCFYSSNEQSSIPPSDELLLENGSSEVSDDNFSDDESKQRENPKPLPLLQNIYADVKVLRDVKINNPYVNYVVPKELVPVKYTLDEIINISHRGVFEKMREYEPLVLHFVLILFKNKVEEELASSTGKAFTEHYSKQYRCCFFVEENQPGLKYEQAVCRGSEKDFNGNQLKYVPESTKALLLAVYMFTNQHVRMDVAHTFESLPDLNIQKDRDALDRAMSTMKKKFAPLAKFRRRVNVVRRLNKCVQEACDRIESEMTVAELRGCREPIKALGESIRSIDLNIEVESPAFYSCKILSLALGQLYSPYKIKVKRRVEWIISKYTTAKSLIDEIADMLQAYSPYKLSLCYRGILKVGEKEISGITNVSTNLSKNSELSATLTFRLATQHEVK